MDTSPSIHRAQQKRSKKFQGGTILSYTTLSPPAPFAKRPRTVGLIELDDGSRVLAPLLGDAPQIGQHVLPRMRLNFVNEQGLRVYDVAYEVALQKPVYERDEIKVFPGYIVALTGPSGVGKSTVSTLLAKSFSHYMAKVPVITTREEKSGDEGEYHYVSSGTFRAMQERGDIVAATEIPSSSEQRQYGYRAKDIESIWGQGKIPVIVTEKQLLQDLSLHFGRRSVLSFGLLPPGKSKRTMLSHLLHRMRTRGRETEEQIQDRLKNAKEDLAFFTKRKDLFDKILVNEDLEVVIEMLERQIRGLCEVPLDA